MLQAKKNKIKDMEALKLANFCGRGLVAKDNRPMKLSNHDTRYLSHHDSDDKKMADDKNA